MSGKSGEEEENCIYYDNIYILSFFILKLILWRKYLKVTEELAESGLI